MNGKLITTFLMLAAMILSACGGQTPAETSIPTVVDTLAVPVTGVTETEAAATQRDDLRVPARIPCRYHLVPAFAQQHTVAHHHGTHRHLTLIGGAVSESERAAHPVFVVFGVAHELHYLKNFAGKDLLAFYVCLHAVHTTG